MISSVKSWPLFCSLSSYRGSYLPGDLFAGITLAAITIPEQMATARLGGFAPQIGFFAFIAGSIGFAMFGRSRVLSCGADSTITPICAGGLALLASSGFADYRALAVGLRIHGRVNPSRRRYLPARLDSQSSFDACDAGLSGRHLGAHLNIPNTHRPWSTFSERTTAPSHCRIVAKSGDSNLFAICIGIGVLVTIAISEVVSPKIPGALIGLIAATGLAIIADLERKGVSAVGAMSGSLPTFTLPDIPLDRWASLLPLSLLVAVVVMVQTAATTRSFPSDPGQPVDVDRDFLGVGAGNVLAGLFGAFPVNASPPRTGIVSQTGGRTQLSGLFAASIVLALLTFGATLLQHIPNAALGGVLLFVASRILRVNQIATICRQSFGEFCLVVATAAAIVVLPIEQGVALGIAMSLLHGIWSTTRARLVIFDRVPGTTVWWPSSPRVQGERDPNVVVVGLQAPLSFLNASRFGADVIGVLNAWPTKPRLLVIEASGMIEIDFTAAQALLDMMKTCNDLGIVVAMARLKSARAQEAFARFEINSVLVEDRVFQSVDQAIRALTHKAPDAKAPGPAR